MSLTHRCDFSFLHHRNEVNSYRPEGGGGKALEGVGHRLKMELDLQSLFGLLRTAVLIG
jgi:hypothetical protein